MNSKNRGVLRVFCTGLASSKVSLSQSHNGHSSSDLQDIVSRAIKLSARESYIRILPLPILDDTLPREAERLDTLQKVTQAKYKFHLHKHTMLMQALSSYASYSSNTGAGMSLSFGNKNKSDSGGDAAILTNLTSQISDTTSAMDNITTDLIIIASHRAQLSSLLATHWGSALAIALRKLNRSYSKRMAELGDAARRVEMLEAEVAEAWSEADRLAREMEELEEFADTIKVNKTEPLISPSFSYPSPISPVPPIPFLPPIPSITPIPFPTTGDDRIAPTSTATYTHPIHHNRSTDALSSISI